VTKALIRPPKQDEAKAIVDLLYPYVAEGLVLPRTPEDIRANPADFLVALCNQRTIGVVALRDFGEELYEIRSLAIHADLAGQGIGSQLVIAAVGLARRRGASRVFVLTLRPHLFERQHFVQVDMGMFPQKVWTDCVKCPKRYCCDEIALLLDFQRLDRLARGT